MCNRTDLVYEEAESIINKFEIYKVDIDFKFSCAIMTHADDFIQVRYFNNPQDPIRGKVSNNSKSYNVSSTEYRDYITIKKANTYMN